MLNKYLILVNDILRLRGRFSRFCPFLAVLSVPALLANQLGRLTSRPHSGLILKCHGLGFDTVLTDRPFALLIIALYHKQIFASDLVTSFCITINTYALCTILSRSWSFDSLSPIQS